MKIFYAIMTFLCIGLMICGVLTDDIVVVVIGGFLLLENTMLSKR